MIQNRTTERQAHQQDASEREVQGPSQKRSLLILGASGLVVIAGGLASAKVAAYFLGPEGVGLLGIVLNVMGPLSAVVLLGAPQALAFLVGRTVEANVAEPVVDWREIAAARLVVVGTSLCLLVISMLFGSFLSGLLFGEADMRLWTAVAISAILFATTQTNLGVLSALRMVSITSKFTAATAFVSPLVGVVFYQTMGISGVFVATAASSAVLAAGSAVVVHRVVGRVPILATNPKRVFAISKIGAPLVPARLVESAAILYVFLLVDRRFGLFEVGNIRAAMTISFAYVVLANNITNTDFLPRISRQGAERSRFVDSCNTQLVLYGATVGPAGAATALLAGPIVSLAFSDEFTAARSIYVLLAPGDFFRICGFVLVNAAFVHRGPLARLVCDAVFAIAFISFSLFAPATLGPKGIALAYLLASILYLLVGMGALYPFYRFSWKTWMWLIGGSATTALPAIIGTSGSPDASWIVPGIAIAVLSLFAAYHYMPTVLSRSPNFKMPTGR